MHAHSARLRPLTMLWGVMFICTHIWYVRGCAHTWYVRGCVCTPVVRVSGRCLCVMGVHCSARAQGGASISLRPVCPVRLARSRLGCLTVTERSGADPNIILFSKRSDPLNTALKFFSGGHPDRRAAVMEACRRFVGFSFEGPESFG